MIVTITGAYRNVGDHLIGHRARALLLEFFGGEIVNIDRKSITDSSYKTINEASAVLLCGGPAYQRKIYPNVYAIDLDRISVPVIPFGLGYKDKLDSEGFRFSDPSMDFVKSLHEKIANSSVRDVVTKEVLNRHGIENVVMTGCPAWYELDSIDKEFQAPTKIDKLIVSAPAKIDRRFFELLKVLAHRFPNSRKQVAFHHGYLPSFHPRSFPFFKAHLSCALKAKRYSYEVVNLAKDLKRMQVVYGDADLHVGLRVHAHIHQLSLRKPSLLICEDSRGVGQAKTLGSKPILYNSEDMKEQVIDATEQILNGTWGLEQSAIVMRNRFEEMKKFIISLRDSCS
jgi:hypothetical protein